MYQAQQKAPKRLLDVFRNTANKFLNNLDKQQKFYHRPYEKEHSFDVAAAKLVHSLNYYYKNLGKVVG